MSHDDDHGHDHLPGSDHGHGHDHGHVRGPGQARPDMTVWLEPGPWEERYAAAESVWSGRPNPVLVGEAAGLEPGRALEAGSGEGADAIWLAEGGWSVTAVDFSQVALDRSAAYAAARGAEVADRLTWLRQDLRAWVPPLASYDLVTSHFLHLASAQLAVVLGRLAAAVAPGGTLLFVGHHPADLDTSMGRPDVPDMMPTAERLAETLDPADWSIERAEARPRSAVTPDGETVTVRDAVLRARRR